MKIIAHRGNLNGPDENTENDPIQIDRCIGRNLDVEIDLWFKKGFWLGHDSGNYEVDLNWILERKNSLWIHCKNMEALCNLKVNAPELNFFWHESDDYTLTSQGWLWCYPGKPVTVSKPNKYDLPAISVMPENISFDISNFSGICTDYPDRY